MPACPAARAGCAFTYLVINRHRLVPRSELADALWREPDPAAVDARLNPLLSKLRRVFGADAVEGRSALRLCLPGAWVDLEAATDGHPPRRVLGGPKRMGPGMGTGADGDVRG